MKSTKKARKHFQHHVDLRDIEDVFCLIFDCVSPRIKFIDIIYSKYTGNFGMLPAPQAIAAWAFIHDANPGGFLVCMNTVPGPENLQTSPSPELSPEIIPPLATRSKT